jgi:two-component system, NtrC family, response regulator AtoC
MEGGPANGHGPVTRTPLELVIVAGDAISVAPLPLGGSVTLGRDETCDVRIQNGSVSRRHARLHLDAQLKIEDLGSANGTAVLDHRSLDDATRTLPFRTLSRQSARIVIGERVHLGAVTIAVRRAAERLPAAAGVEPGTVVLDPAMLTLYEQVGRAAKTSISVLILGETGAGKEVLARTLHARSARAERPYLELNCAALAPSLLEGELFGHEKDAFTGATGARAGLLESADGGTVFLDEVGELPLPVQAKLLRVLEDRKVTRLGGRAPKKLDVRFVAATNRDLEADIARGTFRQDLYFRLNGVSFVIPPLRARVVEIVPLAERFLADAGLQLDRTVPQRLSAKARAALERYPWPGNVRELRNLMERAAILNDWDEITPQDLPAHVAGAAPVLAGPSLVDEGDLGRATVPGPEDPRAVERRRILDALDQCAGNQTRAAKLLGVSLRTLVNRLAEHDIPRPRKRS